MDRRRFLASLAGASLGCGASAGELSRKWSRTAAFDFLVRQQASDGAWRSDVYGMFRGGEALTPLVLRAIHRERPEAAKAGLAWVAKQPIETWTLFPVHNACWLLELAAKYEELAGLRKPLKDRLLDLQLGSRRGWPSGHAFSGGWSYAGEAPLWKAEGELPAMQQPNLSATVLAVAGLHAAGVSADSKVMREARSFIGTCQNFGTGEERSDDGGFFQMQDDLMRNKAGKAGVDAAGTIRFKSYAAATADGLAGLVLTGASPEDLRVRAACRWLRDHPTVSDVPDLRCYAAYARRRAVSSLGGTTVSVLPNPLPQRGNGSVRNPHGEMREDDPLVATSLAVMVGM